jgi:hypothetical protein
VKNTFRTHSRLSVCLSVKFLLGATVHGATTMYLLFKFLILTPEDGQFGWNMLCLTHSHINNDEEKSWCFTNIILCWMLQVDGILPLIVICRNRMLSYNLHCTCQVKSIYKYMTLKVIVLQCWYIIPRYAAINVPGKTQRQVNTQNNKHERLGFRMKSRVI